MVDSTTQQPCPMCGEPVSPVSSVCSACGESVNKRRPLNAGERYLVRKFWKQMMMLEITWYIIGGFLITPLATDWLSGSQNGQRLRFHGFHEAYLSLVLKALGVGVLVMGRACRRWPKWGLNCSLVAGYTVLGCYIVLLQTFDHLPALLFAVPILWLAHTAHKTAYDMSSVGIPLDDKR